MQHIHGYSTRVGGLIISHNPAAHQGDHYDPDEYQHHLCALCNSVCFMSSRAFMFHAANPDMPVLCCTCGELGQELIRRAIPSAHFITRPVPDLANLGTID